MGASVASRASTPDRYATDHEDAAFLGRNWYFLGHDTEKAQRHRARHHFREYEGTARPLGDDRFLARLEKNLRRVLRRQKPGRKPKGHGN